MSHHSSQTTNNIIRLYLFRLGCLPPAITHSCKEWLRVWGRHYDCLSMLCTPEKAISLTLSPTSSMLQGISSLSQRL